MRKLVLKPGEKTGNNGGIFVEVDTKGKEKTKFVTIKDHQIAPPTSKAGHKWKQKHRTPDNS